MMMKKKPMPVDRSMSDRRGRAMPVRGDMSDKMGRAMVRSTRSMEAPMTMKKGGKVKSKAKGGSSYRKAADGVAHKGKTKAKMIKMAMGGKC